MKAMKLCYSILLACSLSSCKISCTSENFGSEEKTKPVTSADKTALTGATIKNDIDLEATGVKIKKYTCLMQTGELLTENVTGIGEKIYVVIKQIQAGQKRTANHSLALQKGFQQSRAML